MGNQIIRQPNGKYAIFSSVVDDFTWTDCTLADLQMIYGSRAYENARKHVDEVIEKLENGEKPYHQFTMTYEEAQKTIAFRHGKDDDEEEGQ